LEPTGGMDTTHVVNAISHFTDVRGIPETITSDNQTSFQRADKELKDWLSVIDFSQVEQKTGFNFKPGHRGSVWIFNPPLGSHFGGVLEIMVKAMKRALRITVSRADLNKEEFLSVFENCVDDE